MIRKMTEASIPHEVIDITRDRVSADYLKRVLRAKSVPVIEAPGFEPVLGYQPDKLKEILDAFGS